MASSSQLDPPAYTPPPPTRHPRSIHDLRTQIIANASVLKPHYNDGRPANDHIEVIVAKTFPPSSSPSLTTKTRSLSLASNPSFDGCREGGKHYAVLIQRGGFKKGGKIVYKSPEFDGVEESLEWLLVETECAIHERIERQGRGGEVDEGCKTM